MTAISEESIALGRRVRAQGRRLPERHRSMLLMSTCGDAEDIAEVLGIAVAQVRQRAKRARRALEILEGEECG